MNRRIVSLALVAVLGLCARVGAQKPDPAFDKVAADYQAAFNKADVKALGALYTADAIRLGTDGQLLVGRAAIEKGYTAAFAGPAKGAKLTLKTGQSHLVTPDVALIEGTYDSTGPTPAKGRYINTLKHEGAHWLLASVVTIPDQPAK